MDTYRVLPAGRLNNDVELLIQRLYGQGYRTARGLNDELAKCVSTGQVKATDKPSLKTLIRRVEALEAIYGSEPAGLKDYGDDARAVLDVLSEVIEQTNGRVRYFTRFEVEWIRRLLPLTQGMQHWHVWYHARAYLFTDRAGHDTASLDHFLAYTPWMSEGHLRRYAEAFRDGRIDKLHWFDVAAYFGDAVHMESIFYPEANKQ